MEHRFTDFGDIDRLDYRITGRWRYAFKPDELLPWRAQRLLLIEAETWCRENLGRRGRDRSWFNLGGFIFVRTSAKATAFKLRWC